MTTVSAKPHQVERNWLLVNAEGQTLGRLATKIAHCLKGKHKAIYTPHVDTGDYIVVINAEKIQVTGNKAHHRCGKVYYRHTGYPGGLKQMLFKEMLAKHPTKILGNAVKGMLPKNSLGRQMFKKLKVYAGTEHPHSAQQPQAIDLMSQHKGAK